MRRVALLAVAALLALAGTAGLIAFFQARDDSQIESATGGPGVEAAGETSARLRTGNVLLTYRSEADGVALRALAEEIGGPPDPALEDAGQAVLVERRPEQRTAIVARAWLRRLEADRAGDPVVREFTEAWLGRGESG